MPSLDVCASSLIIRALVYYTRHTAGRLLLGGFLLVGAV